MTNRLQLAAALAIAACTAVPLTAQSMIQSKRVQFAPGKSAATVSGSLKGDQTVDYLVGARAGQTLSVTLKSSSSSNYFNVLPPGTDTAIFVGSSDGNSFTGKLPASGDTRVRVYLMRNAARRNETANYTLTIGVTGASAAASPAAAAGATGTGDPVTPGNRPAYCRGEVAGMYGTRPTYVKTAAPRQSPSGGTWIDGTVDKGDQGIKKFRCSFDAGGRFIDVMAMTSDGE